MAGCCILSRSDCGGTIPCRRTLAARRGEASRVCDRLWSDSSRHRNGPTARWTTTRRSIESRQASLPVLAEMRSQLSMVLCLLSAIAACARVPPTTVAVPLVGGVLESIQQQRTSPQLLIPADSLTAVVLAPFSKEHGFVLGKPGEPVHCPWAGPSPTGYRVEIVVDSVSRSHAHGTYEISCSSPRLRGAFATGRSARLRRDGSTWIIDKWLSEWIT